MGSWSRRCLRAVWCFLVATLSVKVFQPLALTELRLRPSRPHQPTESVGCFVGRFGRFERFERAVPHRAEGFGSRAQEVPRSDLVVSSEEDVMKLCSLLDKAPEAGACKVEQLKLGNTNALYCLSADGHKHLVRVFGKNPALAFDRGAENLVYEALSAQGLAPRLLAVFGNGRIEEWLEGRPATAAECRRDEVACKVAVALARLHRAKVPTLAASTVPWAWATAQTWLRTARDAVKSDVVKQAPEIAKGLEAIDLEELASMARMLQEEMDTWDLQICFTHNDLSNTNVHWNAEGQTVRLLDFEYGGMNYLGFDLATHFSHWAGGAVDGLYDDSAFPSEAEQERFLRSYAADSERVSLEELKRSVRLTTPLAHLVWGLWALCSLPEAAAGPPTRFSHIEYALRRLAAFRRSLHGLDLKFKCL